MSRETEPQGRCNPPRGQNRLQRRSCLRLAPRGASCARRQSAHAVWRDRGKDATAPSRAGCRAAPRSSDKARPPTRPSSPLTFGFVAVLPDHAGCRAARAERFDAEDMWTMAGRVFARSWRAGASFSEARRHANCAKWWKPRSQVCPWTPKVDFFDAVGERLLDEIVRGSIIARQIARIAPQARQRSLDVAREAVRPVFFLPALSADLLRTWWDVQIWHSHKRACAHWADMPGSRSVLVGSFSSWAASFPSSAAVWSRVSQIHGSPALSANSRYHAASLRGLSDSSIAFLLAALLAGRSRSALRYVKENRQSRLQRSDSENTQIGGSRRAVGAAWLIAWQPSAKFEYISPDMPTIVMPAESGNPRQPRSG
jgi:hypothetical protein